MTVLEKETSEGLGSLVGQDRVKKQLQTWVHHALISTTPLPHVLLTSPPGMGKTTLARLVAQEMGMGEPTMLDLSKMTGPRLVSVFMGIAAEGGGIVLCDEIHAAKKEQQDLVLQLMEEGIIVLPYGGVLEVPWLTIIGATTNPEMLKPALVRRFEVRCELEPYSPADMATIIKGMSKDLGIKLRSDVAEKLAVATLGVPSTARNLLLAYRALGTQATAEGALELVNLESDGLSAQHIRYLRVLRQLGGQVGERAMSTVLGVHPMILHELERTLFERGLVQRSPGGRVLLAPAFKRLKESA